MPHPLAILKCLMFPEGIMCSLAAVLCTCYSLCLEFLPPGQTPFIFKTQHGNSFSSVNLSLTFLPSSFNRDNHSLSPSLIHMHNSVRSNKHFLYFFKFSDWGCVNYIDKEQRNRKKGLCSFIDVNIFTCLGASQERSENPKKCLDLKAYIPF